MPQEQEPNEINGPVAQEVTTPVGLPEGSPVASDVTAEANKPVETDEAETTQNVDAEVVKPIEEGLLGHKAQGASFPKNFIISKSFFFFSTDPVEPDNLSAYKKAEKHIETAQHNIAWAAHTGKGLLFIGDKKLPTGIINLSDATEPETDGATKFHITAKGNKHSFKAASVAERDNWVAQLKEKIAEAKELAAAVTKSDLYKQTSDEFKRAIKEEETGPVDEVADAGESSPKEDDGTKEIIKVAEPKRRSVSRKRASFFGFGKKEEKKEDAKAEEAVVEIPVESVPEVHLHATEEVLVPAGETSIEDKPDEEPQPGSLREKSTAKRNSFFGGVFSKKEKKAAEAKDEIEVIIPETTAAEAAPVIPPVETTTPLAVDVSAPAVVHTETSESLAGNGEAKKEAKEKRKPSLPFAFTKRDKSPAPVLEGEEKISKSAFSKLRATIKGKGAAKTDEKPVERYKEEGIATEDAPVEEVEAGNKTDSVAPATPAVTAAA